jgi:nicotinamidase-related amidase
VALGTQGASSRPKDDALSRDRPFDAMRTAVLIVDVQNATFNAAQETIRPEFFVAARDVVIPNLAKLIASSRDRGVEVIYTVIESLTRDGRDRSLDYKLSDFFIPKTSSSLFNSTNIDYLLRNLGVEDLVVTGFLTDQCIDHTVKDAADRGYFVTCLSDSCMADTRARHEAALAMFSGYCRTMTTADWLRRAGS